MKLLSCHIENFGKLSGFDYEFQDGLNTIKEENGFGKTTFASFIKAMFYGMEIKKNTKMLLDRKKYQPWQGGAFGGSIVFEVNNKKYRLERFFGKKEIDDTFKIYDLSTNLETNDFTQNIGEELFKLNKEAYERSTFISGQNIETSMNDSINAKLGNILENENDINTSEQAIKVLEEAIKNYKKTGGRGEINEKILEKSKLEKKLEQSKIDEKALQERIDIQEKIRQTLKEKENEQENLKKLLTLKIEEEAKNAKLENYKIMQNNLQESRKQLKQYEDFFQAGDPTEEELDALIEKCLLLERYKTQIKNYEMGFTSQAEIETLKQLFENKEISEEIINQKISEYHNSNNIKSQVERNEEKIANLNREKAMVNTELRKEKKVKWGLVLSSILGILIGILGLVSHLFAISFVGIGVGVLAIIVLIIRIKALRKKEKAYQAQEKEQQELLTIQQNLREEEQQLQRSIEQFLNQYTKQPSNLDVVLQLTEIKTNFMRYQDLQNSMRASLEKQEEIKHKLKELEESIQVYLLKYFKEITTSYVNASQELKMKKSEWMRQKQDYEAKLKIKENYEKTNDLKQLENQENDQKIEQFDKNEIEEKIDDLTKEINKLNDEKNYNKNQIEVLESNLETVFDLENELEELEQKIEEMKENCTILEKTKKYLETAKDQFSSHYLKGMKESFMKNLKIINGEEMDINLDVNLNVQVNEQGSNKELRYFSTGYKDLIYICMRLSLIDSLFEKEKPFIILDDPFVNLDENKIKNATNLLKNIAQEYQIIYFICHESRK